MDLSLAFTPDKRNIQYLVESLDIIERNCNSYHQGFRPDYRVIATQLRLLLCDKNRGKENSLALKVFPDLQLHHMTDQVSERTLMSHPIVWIAGPITGIPVYMQFKDFFDLKSNLMSFDKWREQIAVISRGKPYSLAEIIKSVSEKDGGAHIDDNTDEYLEMAGLLTHVGPTGLPTSHKQIIMIAIGEYIVTELRNLLTGKKRDVANKPNHVHVDNSFKSFTITTNNNSSDDLTDRSPFDFYNAIVLTCWVGAGIFGDSRRPAIADEYKIEGYGAIANVPSWPINQPCPYYGYIVGITTTIDIIYEISKDPRFFIICNPDNKNEIPNQEWLSALQTWMTSQGISENSVNILIQNILGHTKEDITKELNITLSIPKN